VVISTGTSFAWVVKQKNGGAWWSYFFDLDDTLIDHGMAEREGATHLHASVGSTVELNAFVLNWSRALHTHFDRYLAGVISFQEQRRARVREVLDRTFSDAAADEVFSIYSKAYETSLTLFPDVLPSLNSLTSHKLGIVTNGSMEQQCRKLTGIFEKFECVVTPDECGSAKPHPEIFSSACRKVGTTPCHSVYVGDRYDLDAQAARSAQMRGIWLDRKAVATPAHESPIIRSLLELPDLLAG